MSFIKKQEGLAKKTLEELIKLQETISENPNNKNTENGGSWLHDRKTRTKLDDIGWVIREKMKERKAT
ncbi:hypothetical protein MNBD_GAMMA01-1301 [hydrothermal vent metagenome]|uniref:Uncharacterized protein n=1 Tax=hydrothermal vent metagenome TaxID=652676 RepID=A0A3B0VF44_9ZZZZ